MHGEIRGTPKLKRLNLIDMNVARKVAAFAEKNKFLQERGNYLDIGKKPASTQTISSPVCLTRTDYRPIWLCQICVGDPGRDRVTGRSPTVGFFSRHFFQVFKIESSVE